MAAARKFAREKFSHHRYALVLHTDQKHPHVHLVVKAENELGRRLHIDKQRLRHWREDFARLMREQEIAANATSRAVRGENTKKHREKVFKAQRYGNSTALLDRVNGIAKELSRSRTIVDPARDRLLETRKSLVAAWMKAADVLDAQGRSSSRAMSATLPTACRLCSPTRKNWQGNSSDLSESSEESNETGLGAGYLGTRS